MSKISKKVYLFDFDDSFTYNIVSGFLELKREVQVFSWKDKAAWKRVERDKAPKLIILGPGPGHPSDYQIPRLKAFLGDDRTFILGICLGHQLLLKAHGFTVVPSRIPIHGQSVKVYDEYRRIFQGVYRGQRYNSLAMQGSGSDHLELIFDENEEIAMAIGENFLSCQFHPESIGSDSPETIYNYALGAVDRMER